MSSAVDIQIVSSPNMEKIENFFKDATYRESIEYSASFNTRLCIERRLRLPFLDPQTGVAQNHSNLFMSERQRMPGFREGQIYTYPAQRWRKSRRQYLNKMYRFPDRPFQALRKDHDALLANAVVTGTPSPIVGTASLGMVDVDFNGSLLEESSSLGAFGGDTSDSKDSQQQPQLQQPHLQPHHHHPPHHHVKEDHLSKEWYYDDIDINDVDSLEEPKSPADDEYDYDPRYGSKKRRKRRIGKRGMLIPGESGSGRRRSGPGRGRASAVSVTSPGINVADTSLTASDAADSGGSMLPMAEPTTPTTSGGKRSRGSGTRGRRRTKATSGNPLSPGISEPPSFEMAAAAVGVISDLTCGSPDEHSDLRNYRKYL